MIKHLNNSSNYPNTSRLFTEICTKESVCLQDDLPDIEQILSHLIEPEILSIKAVTTMEGTSYEGQHLTGKKVILELLIRQKILYVSNSETQSVHVLENEFYQSVYVVAPKLIEGTDLNYLIEHKYLRPDIDIEDVSVRKINNRSIFKSICIIVKLVYRPTYELCCSMHSNCRSSELKILYSNGSNCSILENLVDSKIYKPIWSPTGREISFICCSEHESKLMVYSFNTCSIREFIFTKGVKILDSYCWSPQGDEIVFTGLCNKTKEIFIVNINTHKCRQMTFGNGIIHNYKPSCSSDGEYIAFIRNVSGISNLCLMDFKGLECKKLTSNHSVQYYDWCKNNVQIAFVSSCSTTNDKIYIIDLKQNYKIHLLFENHEILNIKTIKYSPDNRYLLFKASSQDTQDLYIYDFQTKRVQNITENSEGVNIDNFEWNIDSSSVYYVSNELQYQNVYVVKLQNFSKRRITNTESSKIQLSYRPKIG